MEWGILIILFGLIFMPLFGLIGNFGGNSNKKKKRRKKYAILE